VEDWKVNEGFTTIYMKGDFFIGSFIGPARRARVAAQALKGHRAGPTLSPIYRA
jgi:hypothetical protein